MDVLTFAIELQKYVLSKVVYYTSAQVLEEPSMLGSHVLFSA